MRRIDFISGNASNIDESKSPPKKVERLDGTLYCALAYLPSDQVFRGYKSAVISHRQAGQRKDRKISVSPMAYESKEAVIKALNNMIDHVRSIGI